MFLFVRIWFLGAQGKNREPGLQAFCVSKMTGSQISPLVRYDLPPLILAGVFKFMESWSNTNRLVLRRDLKPTALCEFEATGRKANTARAGLL